MCALLLLLGEQPQKPNRYRNMKDSNPIESKSHTLKQLDNLMHFRYLLFREGVHSPMAYSQMLLAFIADVKNLHNRLKDLKNEWKKQLPFGEGDDKDVDWGKWREIFDPDKFMEDYEERCLKYLYEQREIRYPNTDKKSMKPSDVREKQSELNCQQRMLRDGAGGEAAAKDNYNFLVNRQKEIAEDAAQELKKLIKTIRLISQLLSTPPQKLVNELYERLKNAHEIELENNEDDAEYGIRTYQKQLLKSKLIGLKVTCERTDTTYLRQAKEAWKHFLDENGCVNEEKMAVHIFHNRRNLTTYDLEPYFDYLNVLKVNAKKESEKETEEVEQDIANTSRIFKNNYDGKRIDFNHLRTAIENGCLPLIKKKNQWFCLWRVLTDLGLLINQCPQTKFSMQMMEWFPEHHPACTKDSMHVYMTTHLRNVSYKNWNKAKYAEDTMVNRKITVGAFGTFKKICEEMEAALANFCKNPSGKN